MNTVEHDLIQSFEAWKAKLGPLAFARCVSCQRAIPADVAVRNGDDDGVLCLRCAGDAIADGRRKIEDWTTFLKKIGDVVDAAEGLRVIDPAALTFDDVKRLVSVHQVVPCDCANGCQGEAVSKCRLENLRRWIETFPAARDRKAS